MCSLRKVRTMALRALPPGNTPTGRYRPGGEWDASPSPPGRQRLPGRQAESRRAAEVCVELQIEPSEAESHAPPCYTPCGVWCSQLRHMVTRLSRPAIMRSSPSLAASNAGAGEGDACATDVAKYASGRGILSPTSFTSLPIECQGLKEFLHTEDTHRREGAGR